MVYFKVQFLACFFLICLTSHIACRDLIRHKEVIAKTSPFGFIEKLQGSKKGTSVKGMHKLKKYLRKFGYLDKLNGDNRNIFDDTLESAIKTYQFNYKLNVTGVLDKETVSKMMMPRCGVPDIIDGVNTMHRGTNPLYDPSKYAFPENRRKWDSTYLLYRFENEFPEHFMEPIRTAFNIWANKTEFFFDRFPYEDFDAGYADLRIGFYSYEHGDGSPFDGPGGRLAHAFMPKDGRMHFDASEQWIVGSFPRTVDIVSIALHEIGHLLGLDHSNIPDAVMYSHFCYGMIKRTLHEDDIDGINALYYEWD